MGTPTALDFWTLSIALVGALTGLAALGVTVWSVLLAGPRVRVSVANAFTTNTDGWWLSVGASNVGRLAVTILDRGAAFRAGGEWKNVPAAAMLADAWQGPAGPYRLEDGEAVTWLIRPDVLAAAVADEHGEPKIRGYVRLATGRTVRSRNRIDIANLARLR